MDQRTHALLSRSLADLRGLLGWVHEPLGPPELEEHATARDVLHATSPVPLAQMLRTSAAQLVQDIDNSQSIATSVTVPPEDRIYSVLLVAIVRARTGLLAGLAGDLAAARFADTSTSYRALACEYGVSEDLLGIVWDEVLEADEAE